MLLVKELRVRQRETAAIFHSGQNTAVHDRQTDTYCEVHKAKELAQHLNHWTEAEAWQCLTHVLCQVLEAHVTVCQLQQLQLSFKYVSTKVSSHVSHFVSHFISHQSSLPTQHSCSSSQHVTVSCKPCLMVLSRSSWHLLYSVCLPMFHQSTIIHLQDMPQPSRLLSFKISVSFCTAVFSRSSSFWTFVFPRDA